MMDDRCCMLMMSIMMVRGVALAPLVRLRPWGNAQSPLRCASAAFCRAAGDEEDDDDDGDDGLRRIGEETVMNMMVTMMAFSGRW